MLKGLRMLIHDRPDPDFASSAAHRRGVSLLERFGLTYDLLIKPRNLPSALALVDALPQQKFVIDHIGKPNIAKGEMEPWLSGLRALAERGNVFCKLSSLTTQAHWHHWRAEQFHPYLDHVLDAFGAERLMIGSDWPVNLLAGDYRATMGIVTDWALRLSADEQRDILGGACARFYDLAQPSA